MPDREKNQPDAEEVKSNLCDDVRSFLLKRLVWNRLTSSQRDHIREVRADKEMRRPSYLTVEASVDDVPEYAKAGCCHIGAEGVMAHADEGCVHLVFKCGNPRHPFHYSTFGVETITALAKACEATWPGTISRSVERRAEESQTPRTEADKEDDKLILDPGPDEDASPEPDEDVDYTGPTIEDD